MSALAVFMGFLYELAESSNVLQGHDPLLTVNQTARPTTDETILHNYAALIAYLIQTC